MNSQIKFKVKSLMQEVNKILIGNTFEFEEDRTVLIELAISEFNCLPAIKFYEEGLCKKLKEQQVVEHYAHYIGKGKEQEK